MTKPALLLKFRDLITEDGDTIAEHRAIIKSSRSVWWGAWMRKGAEKPPREFLAEILEGLSKQESVKVYLFDTSQELLYSCSVKNIKVSPIRSGITSPEPDKTPEYYHRNRLPIWFQFTTIDDATFSDLNLYYHSAPSLLSEDEKYRSSQGNRLSSVDERSSDNSLNSLRDLTHMRVTMWVLNEGNGS